MLVYSTTTGQSSFDPAGYAAPEVVVPEDEHTICVHSIGYCGVGDWD